MATQTNRTCPDCGASTTYQPRQLRLDDALDLLDRGARALAEVGGEDLQGALGSIEEGIEKAGRVRDDRAGPSDFRCLPCGDRARRRLAGSLNEGGRG